MASPNLLEMDLVARTDDWSPTPHGIFMAEVLARHNVVRGKEVLELGGGLGNHTILLARQGARRVVTTEIEAGRSETTRRNVDANCPDATNVAYRVADWLNTDGEFDVVTSNPPFAKSGPRNRRYFIDALILDVHKRLRPDGHLVFVQSSMADLAKTQRRLEENGFDSRILESREGPFRDSYFEDETFMEEIKGVPDGYEVRDGTYYETLFVIMARLPPWAPREGAH